MRVCLVCFDSVSVHAVAASKGFWAEMLGVGDFYYEVSVPSCCMALYMHCQYFALHPVARSANHRGLLGNERKEWRLVIIPSFQVSSKFMIVILCRPYKS